MNELELKIEEIIPRTYNIKSFRLGVAKDIDFKAGQFMIELRRCYEFGKEFARRVYANKKTSSSRAVLSRD